MWKPYWIIFFKWHCIVFAWMHFILDVQSNGCQPIAGFLVGSSLFCAHISYTDRRIKRGISTTANDAQIISIARDMLQTVQEGESNCIQGFIETPEYTFILPDISHYPDDFKGFLNKDLIETSTLVSLEQAGQF